MKTVLLTMPPKPADQSTKNVVTMKTRSTDTPSRNVNPSTGTPAASKAQLKIVQDPTGAVEMAPPTPPPVTEDEDNSIKGMLKKMDAKLESSFKELENKFTGLFDRLQGEMKGLREEVAEARTKFAELETKVNGMEDTVEFNSGLCQERDEEQTASLKAAKAELETKVKELEDKLLLQEKQDRKYNLHFYGIPEEQGENIDDRLKTLFLDDLGLDYDRVNNMYFVHRMPSKSPGPKPIIRRFCQYQDRDLVLSNSYKLAGSKRRITSDLPVIMKAERARLAKIAYKIRKDEKLKTRIKGLDVYLEVRKDDKDQWTRRDASIKKILNIVKDASSTTFHLDETDTFDHCRPRMDCFKTSSSLWVCTVLPFCMSLLNYLLYTRYTFYISLYLQRSVG